MQPVRSHRWRLTWPGMAVLVIPVLAASTAHAQMTETYRSGLWAAYSGTTSDHRPLCAIATTGGEGRRVAIRQYAGETGLEIQLSKDSWAIPANTQAEVRFQFDGRPATQDHAVGSGQTLALPMSFERSVSFMRALRHGRVLSVIFPEGNEPAWTGGLSGSGNVITAFNTCRESLASSAQAPQGPTQPFRTAPTQPTGPTQPFTPPPAAAPASPPASPPALAPAPLPIPAPNPPQRG